MLAGKGITKAGYGSKGKGIIMDPNYVFNSASSFN